MCENQKIPFYSIPTPYTSRTCSECNHQEKDNRKGNEFKCLQCGYEDDSHKNAANNIANFGKEYYNNEFPYGRNNNYPNNWSCHTVIKHYKKQSSRSLVNC